MVLVSQVDANSVEGEGEDVLEATGFTKGTETFMHCKVQKYYFIIRNKTLLSYWSYIGFKHAVEKGSPHLAEETGCLYHLETNKCIQIDQKVDR